MQSRNIPPPPLKLLLAESRFLPELGRFWLSEKSLSTLPKGHEAVLVIPGFGASDFHTRPLRRALSKLGHTVHGWGLGLNTGMNSRVREKLLQRISQLQQEHGQPIQLIGWSLGGVFVRELARQMPDQVAQVFTLGSPFNITPAANNMLPLFKLMNRGKPVKLDMEGFLRRAEPPPVDCTAIYTKTDGIVAWQTACENEAENTENLEVRGSHFGLVCNPDVVRIIAERLAR
ncbi:MAG: hypothetical protein R3352_00445 [Salinisphaeraceae bacterium]|nr:hypothetical protein [Salinisphaeraceae bacterium]